MLNPWDRPAPERSDSSRALGDADLPAVAALHLRVFRQSEDPPPRCLVSRFAEIFLSHYWFDPQIPSSVPTDSRGGVRDFHGMLPLRKTFREHPLRAAVASHLMTEPGGRDAPAGSRGSAGARAQIDDVRRVTGLRLRCLKNDERAGKWLGGGVLGEPGIAGRQTARRGCPYRAEALIGSDIPDLLLPQR